MASPTESIRRSGFRRWYERQLIEGHAYFVTCFLLILVVAIGLEELSFRTSFVRFSGVLALLVGAAVAAIACWRRYRTLLDEAEWLAEQSVCGACGTYGRFEVEQTGGGTRVATPSSRAELAGITTVWMRVRCRHCDHRWLIE